MTNQERISTWLEKGDHDLSSAKIIFLHLPQNIDVVGFHCQQAVEKYLKAYLIFLYKEFKPVHDLTYLLNLIIPYDKDFDGFYEPVARLDSYAVKIRYPEFIIAPSEDEIKEAITTAEKVRSLIFSKTGKVNP